LPQFFLIALSPAALIQLRTVSYGTSKERAITAISTPSVYSLRAISFSFSG